MKRYSLVLAIVLVASLPTYAESYATGRATLYDTSQHVGGAIIYLCNIYYPMYSGSTTADGDGNWSIPTSNWPTGNYFYCAKKDNLHRHSTYFGYSGDWPETWSYMFDGQPCASYHQNVTEIYGHAYHNYQLLPKNTALKFAGHNGQVWDDYGHFTVNTYGLSAGSYQLCLSSDPDVFANVYWDGGLYPDNCGDVNLLAW